MEGKREEGKEGVSTRLELICLFHRTAQLGSIGPFVTIVVAQQSLLNRVSLDNSMTFLVALNVLDFKLLFEFLNNIGVLGK